jgi:hypothetical protein
VEHRGIAFSVVEMSFSRGWRWKVEREERSRSASAPKDLMRSVRPRPLSTQSWIGQLKSS